MLNNKTFLRIFSLIAAILLWAFVMIEEDPYKTVNVRDINVEFVNEDVLAEKGLVPITNGDMKLAARIKGKRSQINDVKDSEITAYVDVSSCTKGQNNFEIVMNVPDGIRIESVTKTCLKFNVEELQQESRPLSIGFSKENEEHTEDGKVPWVVSSNSQTVVVVGAGSIIEKVDRVEGTVSANNISEQNSDWRGVSVIPVNKDGKRVSGVSVQNEESIRAQVRLMTLKTVDLHISADNVQKGFAIDTLDADDKIRIVGTTDLLDNIKKIEGIADMDGIVNTQDNKIKVNLNVPEGIYLYNKQNPLNVKIKLKAVQ